MKPALTEMSVAWGTREVEVSLADIASPTYRESKMQKHNVPT
jgi:hypothetical protein